MSFSRELKDFVGGFSSGYKLVDDPDDKAYKKLRNQLATLQVQKLGDPENLSLEKQLRKAQIARYGAMNTESSARAKYWGALGDRSQLQAPAIGEPPTAIPPPSQGATPVVPPVDPSKVSALPLDEDEAQLSSNEGDETQDQPTQPVQAASKGGMIRRYAGGGAVDEDDSSDPSPDEDSEGENENSEYAAQQAVPTGGTQVASAAPTTGDLATAAHDAVRDGLVATVRQHGLDTPQAVASPQRTAAYRAYRTGAGAAPPVQMDQVRKLVDPEGKMSEAERNFLSLGAVYNFYMKQGDEPAAQKAAQGMLAYYRNVANHYEALAQVAAEHGDVDGTVKAMAKMYAATPDGRDLKITKDPKTGTIQYDVTDIQSGKTVHKDIATPDQLLKFASQGTFNKFDQLILAASGARGEQAKYAAEQKAAAKAAQPPKAMPVKDLKTADELVSGAGIEDAGVKNVVLKLFTNPQNRQQGVTVQDAKDIVTGFSDPTAKFEAKPVAGGKMVRNDKGATVFIPDDQFDVLQTQRAAKMKEAKDQSEKAGQPGFIPRMVGAVKRGVDATPPNEASPYRVAPQAPRGQAPYGSALEDISRREYHPAPETPMSEIDQINAARRAQGMPPVQAIPTGAQ